MASARNNLPGPAAIREAKHAAASGDIPLAVRKLVAAWVELPLRRIAVLASKLTARLPLQPLPAKIAQREEVWLAFAARHDPELLPTLLAGDWPVHPRAAKARLAHLVDFPPDPRIALTLYELWNTKRYRSNAGGPFWRTAFRTLREWGDPELSRIVRTERTHQDVSLLGIFSPEVAEDYGSLPGEPLLDVEVERDLAALEATLIDPPPVTTAETKQTLLDAVHDDPGSDAPRGVLADALLADGDPRGELIQLQLAKRTSRTDARIKALLRASGVRWLDGLDGVVMSPVFRRGFVADVTVDASLPTLQLERRAWCTVEALRFCNVVSRADHERATLMLLHENFAAVRRVDGVPVAAIAALPEPRSLDYLGLILPLVPITSSNLRVRDLAIAGSLEQIDVARRYAPIAVDAIFTWFAASPLRSCVEHLAIDRFESDLPAAWRWFQSGSLATLTLRPQFVSQPMAWELTLTRDAGGAGSVLEATWQGRLYGERDHAGIGPALAALPADALTRLTVKSAARLDPTLQGQLVTEITDGIRAQRGLATPTLFEKRRR